MVAFEACSSTLVKNNLEEVLTQENNLILEGLA